MDVARKLMGRGEQETVIQHPLHNVRYSGPPPLPHPAVEDPTPEEQFQNYQTAKNQNIFNRDLDYQTRVHTTSGSLWGKLKNTAGAAASFAGKQASRAALKVQQQTNSIAHHRAQQSFEHHFADIARINGLQLLGSFSCKVNHQGSPHSVTLYVTNNMVCLHSNCIRDMVQYDDICSMQLSVTLPTEHHGAPYFALLPHERVRPDALQIYLMRGEVIQLYHFGRPFMQGTANVVASMGGAQRSGHALPMTKMSGYYSLMECFNWLDHCWRAMTAVPLPNAEYSTERTVVPYYGDVDGGLGKDGGTHVQAPASSEDQLLATPPATNPMSPSPASSSGAGGGNGSGVVRPKKSSTKGEEFDDFFD